MNKEEAEQEEEFSEWVVIPTSSPIDACAPQNSPKLQSSHRRESSRDNEDGDEDYIISAIEEETEEGESSSAVNLSLPWRVIETAKKQLIKNSEFFERVGCDYMTRRRVVWSFSLIGGLVLVSSLVYLKLMRWWKRVQEEKLRFLLVLLREKDQRIKQLMDDSRRLNEMLSSRRRVRVVRILRNE